MVSEDEIRAEMCSLTSWGLIREAVLSTSFVVCLYTVSLSDPSLWHALTHHHDLLPSQARSRKDSIRHVVQSYNFNKNYNYGAFAICSSHIRQGVHQNASPRIVRLLLCFLRSRLSFFNFPSQFSAAQFILFRAIILMPW